MKAIEGDYLGSDYFSGPEKAAMRWAEVLTLREYFGKPGAPPASEPAMEELKQHYNEAQIVEITMVSGFFNFWNRFTDGLQIDIEDHDMMTRFKKSTKIDTDEFVDYMRSGWWNEKS
ncbi:MAG: carboxymuconolactone decarboxylase family protein [Rhodospirillales bacterium]|nr:carboxymuconolactone decarboxylase family protein [Rhodospirillales bacterium]